MEHTDYIEAVVATKPVPALLIGAIIDPNSWECRVRFVTQGLGFENFPLSHPFFTKPYNALEDANLVGFNPPYFATGRRVMEAALFSPWPGLEKDGAALGGASR